MVESELVARSANHTDAPFSDRSSGDEVKYSSTTTEKAEQEEQSSQAILNEVDSFLETIDNPKTRSTETQELEHERIPTRLQAVLHDYPLDSPMEGSAMLVETPHEADQVALLADASDLSHDTTMIDHGSSAEVSDDSDILTPEDLSSDFNNEQDPRKDKRRTLTLANYQTISESVPEIVLQSPRPGSPPQSSTPLYTDHSALNSIDVSPIASPAHDLSEISLSDFIADQASSYDPLAATEESSSSIPDDSTQQTSFQTAVDSPLVSPTDERSATRSQAGMDYFGSGSVQEIEAATEITSSTLADDQVEDKEQESTDASDGAVSIVSSENAPELGDAELTRASEQEPEVDETSDDAEQPIPESESAPELGGDQESIKVSHGAQEMDETSEEEIDAEEANTTISQAVPSAPSTPNASPLRPAHKTSLSSPTKVPLSTLTPQALQQHNALSRMQIGRSISLQDLQPRRALSYISNGSNESTQSLFSNTLRVGGMKRSGSRVGLSLGLDRGSVLGMERSDIGRMEDFDEGDREEEDVD